MRRHSMRIALSAALLWTLGGWTGAAQTQTEQRSPMLREIFVPFEELGVLLDSQAQRMLLSREEYESLLRKAGEKVSAPWTPHAVLPVSAVYEAVVEQDRAEVTGTIGLDVLRPGLQVVDLELANVGLRGATLDGRAAALGRTEQGRLRLFLEGVGRHELLLEMVTPVETTAALQTLTWQGPTTPASRMRVRVAGDVEVKSGAHVVTRTFDEGAQATQFELLPPPGPMTLVMTLNNRLLQSSRVVLARGVLVDEITTSYERLHATFSLAVLHRPVDSLRFALPDGFELTDVKSLLLAQWALDDSGPTRVLNVRLREPTTETVVITLSAVRTPAPLEDWALPDLKPLDVLGEVAVVGLLLEDQLKLQTLRSEHLIPIDTSVLTTALPDTVFEAERGAPALRPVAAFYAPTGSAGFDVRARFTRPAGRLQVTTNLLLTLGERELQIRGGLTLQPEIDRLFAVEVKLPPDWHVLGVTDQAGQPLTFESVTDSPGAGRTTRLRVRLPAGVAPGQEYVLLLQAVHTPAGWLSEWSSTQATFPVFAVQGATRDVGAIAVQPGEDLTVYPDTLDRLTPLDEKEATRYGLPGGSAAGGMLAYRYDSPPYSATFRVVRVPPRLTARSYSFLRLGPGVLTAHYEIVYDIREARTRRLVFVLPATTPADVRLRAIDGVNVKEYEGAVAGDVRRWTVLLADGKRDTVRLAVDFDQRLGDADELQLDLPVVRADDVAYQSGLVAVEGSAELDVDIIGHPRKVDVGELAGAEYQPAQAAMGGLGVFGYVGEAPAVQVRVARRAAFGVPRAIVQRAELTTLVSADGLSQTAARFRIRSKADFLEIELPSGSQLWSAELDGQPAKPQRAGRRLLLSLAGEAAAVRDLRIVYESPADPVAFWGTVDVPALRLLLPPEGGQTTASEVPVADLAWHVSLPAGYRIVDHGGTVSTTQVQRPEPAAWTVARTLYRLAGGVHFFYGGLLPSLSRARVAAKSARQAPELRSSQGIELLGGAESAPTSEMAAIDRLRELGYVQTTVKPAEGQQGVQLAPGEAEEGKKLGWAGQGGGAYWALEGVRSLKIELERSEEAVSFQSLGGAPRLSVTLAQRRRVEALTWGLSLSVVLVGLTLRNRRTPTRVLYVIAVIAAATLLPLVTARVELAHVTNGPFYAASLLAGFYLAAAFVRWLVARAPRPGVRSAALTAAVVLVLLRGGTASAADGAVDDSKSSLTVEVVEPPKPVKVPDDAIIVPYDPQAKVSPEWARGLPGPLLVPYQKYIELWNAAYPTRPTGDLAPPAPYALAGAAYAATLGEGEALTVEGQIDIDVFAEAPVAVPLKLGGGVLTRAELDGNPARLGVSPAQVPGSAPGQQAQVQEAPPPDVGPLLLQIQGKGRHRLDLAVRLPIARRGGWRAVSGSVPGAPATGLTLRVPDAGTQVRLGSAWDRRSYESTAPGEIIATALDAEASLAVQWRPKVQEGRVDPTLTASSVATLDIREDGLHLIWKLNLDFGHSERDTLTVAVPRDYLVEKVDGPNVRGWAAREEDASTDTSTDRHLDVFLLKPVRGAESIVLVLHCRAAVGEPEFAAFDVPLVQAIGAALHNGQFTIRRSPLLDLRTDRTAGVTRADAGAEVDELVAQAAKGLESPLGVRPYQTYRFAATPFVVRLAASRRLAKPDTHVQTVLRIAERQRSLETCINVSPAGVPVYRLRVALPTDLRVEHVDAPGAFEWAVSTEADSPVLAVYLSSGQQQRFPVVIRGTLGEERVVESVPLPRLEVLAAGRQDGEIVVQVDPAFDLQATELRNCRETEIRRAMSWLSAAQQPWARLALRCDSPDCGGTLRLTLRSPQVACATITNVRVTETAIEETILLDFDITRAGLRSLTFTLPHWMKDSRITVPMLREKRIEPASADTDAPLRVTLTLQDEVMGRLRVLVENDRLLTPDLQQAPIPIVETGRTDRRSVALESAGRDEVVVATLTGLEALVHRQKDWQELADLLGGRITQAYIATGPAPVLAYQTKERVAVETAGARIGLAQTVLAVDGSGIYRAAQTYHINNTTEPFLEVQLPPGAELWSAVVAGDPVKPARASDPSKPRNVRIPLVKTAAGDLDCAVTLHYGGRTVVGGLLRKVEFPIARTVNVPVELSQVQLYLPEDFRWFDFGGTTRQVIDKGDLAAGYIRYETQVAERLAQTMTSASRFDQVRAAANWGNLRERMGRFQESAAFFGYNLSVQQELYANEETVRRGDVQLQQLAQSAAPTTQPVLDNREKLNVYYEAQRTNRARNMVQDLSGNFADVGAPEPAAPARTGQEFDRTWFDANKLSSTAPATPKDAAEPLAGKAAKGGRVMQPAKRPAPSQKGGKVALPAESAGGTPPVSRQRGQGAAKEEAATLYQQRLEAQSGRRAGAAGPAMQSPQQAGEPAREEPDAGVQLDREAGYAESSARTMATGEAAGLASLTVEFPLRGQPHYFTTPRGDVSITARSASRAALDMLAHAGVVLLALLLLALGVRLARQRRPVGLTESRGRTTLIVLGLAGIVTGVLPIAGVAAVTLGVVLRIARPDRKSV